MQRDLRILTSDETKELLATPVKPHHHAYLWTGGAWPSWEERTDNNAVTPPVEPVKWLTKPMELHKAVCTEPYIAMKWLALQLAAYEPAEGWFDEMATKQRALVRLKIGGTYKFSCRTRHGLIVSLALVACTGERGVCPRPPDTP